jgi:hypothetical protein
LKTLADEFPDNTGPPNRKETDLASEGLRLLSKSWRTLEGIETMSMIRKGRVKWVAKGDVLVQVRFIDNLFEIAA